MDFESSQIHLDAHLDPIGKSMIYETRHCLFSSRLIGSYFLTRRSLSAFSTKITERVHELLDIMLTLSREY